jgi:hypothetical protein
VSGYFRCGPLPSNPSSSCPFIETNEIVVGYAAVEVADLDEALRMARSWPGRGVVEIRPVMAR